MEDRLVRPSYGLIVVHPNGAKRDPWEMNQSLRYLLATRAFVEFKTYRQRNQVNVLFMKSKPLGSSHILARQGSWLGGH